MALVHVWGAINADGTKDNGSENFTVRRTGQGRYDISFNKRFKGTPAIVGSQTNFGLQKGIADQDTRDNVIFPVVMETHAEVRTGDSGGGYWDRSFSFIAIGESE